MDLFTTALETLLGRRKRAGAGSFRPARIKSGTGKSSSSKTILSRSSEILYVVHNVCVNSPHEFTEAFDDFFVSTLVNGSDPAVS